MKKNKKVLIITYYWPPSGGPGVQRVLKFVKYLIRANWEVVVLTVKDGEYPAIDKNLEKDIPKECKVYKTPTFELFNLFKSLSGKNKNEGLNTFILDSKKKSLFSRFSSFVRLNFFIPDARIGWKRYGIKEGMKIIAHEKPDIIFSSSPPHSLQLIAKTLSKKTNTPWVADLRDPWNEAFWDKGLNRYKWAKRKNLKLEIDTLNAAHAFTTVSNGLINQLHINDKSLITVIPNGYDQEDFVDIPNTENNKFTIVYTGYVARSQCPELLIKAIAQLDQKYKEKIQVDLYGKQDQYFWELINKYNCKDIFTDHGYVSHQLAVQKMRSADMLLLFIPIEFGKGILTGKLFEYLATKKYILGFGDPDSEASQILKKCNVGEMISYNTNPTNHLRAQMDAWKDHSKLLPNHAEINKFNRESLTAKLIETLEKTIHEVK